MPLSCDYDDICYADWFAEPDDDFSQLSYKTSDRCCSCGKKLYPGNTVLRHRCWRPPTEEEEREGGYDEDGEVPLPDGYLCETCGEIRLNLEAAGYAVSLGDDMRILMQEYQQMTGFDPSKYATDNSQRSAVQNG